MFISMQKEHISNEAVIAFSSFIIILKIFYILIIHFLFNLKFFFLQFLIKYLNLKLNLNLLIIKRTNHLLRFPLILKKKIINLRKIIRKLNEDFKLERPIKSNQV